MKKLAISATLLALLAAGAARAEEDGNCTTADKATWMTIDAFKAQAKAEGLDVRKVKVEGSCYELYAIDANGKRIEAKYDPATGKKVADENGEDD